MRSSALDAEPAYLIGKLGFYIHPGVGGMTAEPFEAGH